MKFIKQLKAGTLLSMSLFFFACQEQNTCKNLNPILDQTDFKSRAYKNAIIEAIGNLPEGEVGYFLDDYVVSDSNEYLVASIKSKNVLCAKAQFIIEPYIDLENIRKTKGIGYRGAQLKGLQFESKQKADDVVFVITKIESVID